MVDCSICCSTTQEICLPVTCFHLVTRLPIPNAVLKRASYTSGCNSCESTYRWMTLVFHTQKLQYTQGPCTEALPLPEKNYRADWSILPKCQCSNLKWHSGVWVAPNVCMHVWQHWGIFWDLLPDLDHGITDLSLIYSPLTACILEPHEVRHRCAPGRNQVLLYQHRFWQWVQGFHPNI